MVRSINQSGRELIKTFEGFHSGPYKTPYDIWAIGYGHTRTVRSGMAVTQDQAEQLLDDDIRIIQRSIGFLVGVPLNENQYSALAAFTFDVGILNLERSNLLKLLNRGWYEQVPVQFMKWDKFKPSFSFNINQRRLAESRLWNKPIAKSLIEEDDETTFSNVG